MKKFYEGSMAFDSEQYKNIDKMMEDVGKVVSVLVENGYAVVFRYEDAGIYILEYGYEANNRYGAPGYTWLTAEEYENVLTNRFEDED